MKLDEKDRPFIAYEVGALSPIEEQVAQDIVTRGRRHTVRTGYQESELSKQWRAAAEAQLLEARLERARRMLGEEDPTAVLLMASVADTSWQLAEDDSLHELLYGAPRPKPSEDHMKTLVLEAFKRNQDHLDQVRTEAKAETPDVG